MNKILTSLKKRHYRVRSKVSGTSIRPRLSVYKSNKHLFVQVIDDEKNITIAGGSTRYVKKEKDQKMSKSDSSKALGEMIATKAKDKGVTTVVFDRGGYKYHGRVKLLADSARENGLVF